jgi:hypothetical protein
MIAGKRARGIAPGIANARRTTSERRTQSVGVQAELALAKELGLKSGYVEVPHWTLTWEEGLNSG